MNLPDGKYLTRPNWGKVLREVEIVSGVVCLNDFSFTQEQFFEVNTLIKEIPCNHKDSV